MIKKITGVFFAIALCLTNISIEAQNIGIGNTNPQVSLDIQGALSLRPNYFAAANAPITTLNVMNITCLKFSSDNNDPQQRYINLTAGKPGQFVVVMFSGVGAARMVNGSGLQSGGKLLLSGDMTFDSPSLIALWCDGVNWIELFRQNTLRAESVGDSITYNSPGSFQFKVPPGITSIKVMLLGAGGWGGGTGTSTSGQGGKGGYVSGDIAVTEGEILDVSVGIGGGPNFRAQASSIKRSSTYLAMAGAGGNGCRLGGAGGPAGPSAGDGTPGSDPFLSGTPGRGATAISPGLGGNAGTNGNSGGAGAALLGGTVSSGQAGEGYGGNGWFGGGASGTFNNQLYQNGPYAAGGGGGGSNYTGGLSGTIISNSNGAAGGTGSNAGSGGLVRIIW